MVFLACFPLELFRNVVEACRQPGQRVFLSVDPIEDSGMNNAANQNSIITENKRYSSNIISFLRVILRLGGVVVFFFKGIFCLIS